MATRGSPSLSLAGRELPAALRALLFAPCVGPGVQSVHSVPNLLVFIPNLANLHEDNKCGDGVCVFAS